MTRVTNKQRRRIRRCYRMARAVAAKIAPKSGFNSMSLELGSVARVERQCRIMSKASSFGYQAAYANLQARLLAAVISLQGEVDEAMYLVSSQPDCVATVSDIFADLIAMDSEFAGVELNFADQTIAVTTEAVELDETYLGPFEIVLELHHLGQSHPYRVVATDPNPASTCDSTTHPHVQNEELCEGEGHLPIKRALEGGRLLDFFTIVNQTLHTYNAGNAYICLSDWSGAECRDCGSTVDDDDISSCARCDGQICGECTCSCQRCDDVYCDDCTTACEGCQDNFCGSCIESCDRCDKPFCDDCLTEGKCDDCTNEENETPSADQNESSDVEVHADGMGEVAVPA